MRITWIMCILISLALHMGYLARSRLIQRPAAPARAVPIIIEPQEPLPAELPELPIEPVAAEIATTAPPPTAANYRPNLADNTPPEPQPEPEPEPELEPESAPEPQPAPKPGETENVPEETASAEEPMDRPENSEQPAPKTYDPRQHAQYRQNLLQDFDDDWQKVPALNTTIKDLAQLPAIDRHFGIAVLAYGFVDHKPAPPFYHANPDTGSFKQTDTFDFTPFSNRIKDRMLSESLRRNLDGVRTDRSSLVKVIGLVPVQADRYFATKQLNAVKLAGARLNQVASTDGHYEPDGSGGFSLIIDSVRTTAGKTIPIVDDERPYIPTSTQ